MAAGLDDQMEKLDLLLEKYLELLDEYEQSRKELSSSMSAVSVKDLSDRYILIIAGIFLFGPSE
jgi:hypothetical protein